MSGINGINLDATGALSKWDTAKVVDEPDGKITREDMEKIINDPEKRFNFFEDIVEEYFSVKNKGEQVKADKLANLIIDMALVMNWEKFEAHSFIRMMDPLENLSKDLKMFNKSYIPLEKYFPKGL
ncbi:MAG: hypothetical protein LBL50_02475 [Candidatus Margulisbacteria bacterium]|jgi:hypothetical protein|nr:hypothetical protein [Candidatus Margulisiibacteriota bacterium]